MTKQKSTKRALLLSALSLLMCVSMLIGSTFAWFTDSVTSGNNRIVAGNLDIELEYYNGSAWNTVNNATDLFTGNLWEPGHTEVVYLKLSNLGSLALKYQLGIKINSEIEGTNVDGNKFKLSDYIYMGVVENVNGETGAYAKNDAGRAQAIAEATNASIISTGYTKTGSMVKDQEALYLAVVVYMPYSVENEANYKTGTTPPEINLGINLVATQLTNENDSFGPDYDADALACDILATPETIDEILATVEPGTVIGLKSGEYDVITLTQNDLTLVSNGAVVGQLDLNEKDGITVDGLTFDAANAKTAYNAKGANSGYVANLTDGKANNGGSVGVEIKDCAFIGTAADSTKYIPVYFGDASRGNRSDEITIKNCEFSTNALQYIALNGVTNNSGKTSGYVVIENNVFGGVGFGTSHNTINATGAHCNWTVVGNTFYNWNVEKTAIGSSRTTSNTVLTWNVSNNKFYHEDGAVVMALKTSYTAENTVVTFENNTALDGMAEIVDTAVNAENETVFAGKKISSDYLLKYVSTTSEVIDAVKDAPVDKETVVILADGTYAGNIDITLAALGSVGGDVVIKAADGANPVIEGTVTIGYRQQGVGAASYNAKVTFEGITFDHAEAGKHCLNVQDVESFYMVNCTVIGDGEYGLSTPGSNGTGAAKIEKCKFINAGLQLAGKFAQTLVIDDCEFEESVINVQGGGNGGPTIQNSAFDITLTAAHNGGSFYVIRNSNAGANIKVNNCEINVDAEQGFEGEAGSKGWGVFVNRASNAYDISVENVAITMTEAALAQSELNVAKCLTDGKINMTNVTVNGKAAQ